MLLNDKKENRCQCGRLLFKGNLFDFNDEIEIKCPKCGRINTINASGQTNISRSFLDYYEMLIDEYGVIAKVSENSIITGYDRGEIVGMTIDKINKKMSLAEYKNIFNLIRNNDYYRLHATHTSKNGSLLKVMCSIMKMQVNGRDYIYNQVEGAHFLRHIVHGSIDIAGCILQAAFLI